MVDNDESPRGSHRHHRRHVLTAPNRPAAVGLLHGDERIDRLFSGVVMRGGMKGYELIREARKFDTTSTRW